MNVSITEFICVCKFLIKSLLKCFLWLLLRFRQLNINNPSLVDIYSRKDLQSKHLLLWSPSERSSTRLDNELDINSKLSKNFILYVIVLLFSISSFIGTEGYLLYFSVFFPRHLNCSLNYSASSLIIKWWSYLEPLWNTARISFSILLLHHRLQLRKE